MLRRSGAETLAEMLQGLLDGVVVTRRLAGNGFLVHRRLRLAVVPGGADDDRVADVFAGAGLRVSSSGSRMSCWCSCRTERRTGPR